MGKLLSFTEKYLREQKERDQKESLMDFYKNCIMVSNNAQRGIATTEDGNEKGVYIIDADLWTAFQKSLDAKIKDKLKQKNENFNNDPGPGVA
jgi:GTP cyclohydrolase FolE2